MQVVENLKSRWKSEWTARSDLVRVGGAFQKTVHFIESLPHERVSLAKTGELSTKGMDEAVRRMAAEKIVPDLRRAAWEVEKLGNQLKNERVKLGVPAPDKSDIAGALLRQEIRSFLRGMEHSERVASITADPAFLESAMEGPAALSGLTEELRADLANRMIERANGPAIEAIEGAREAAEVASSAIEIAIDMLRKECGFDRGHQFDAWMAVSSAGVEREIAEAKART